MIFIRTTSVDFYPFSASILGPTPFLSAPWVSRTQPLKILNKLIFFFPTPQSGVFDPFLSILQVMNGEGLISSMSESVIEVFDWDRMVYASEDQGTAISSSDTF